MIESTLPVAHVQYRIAFLAVCVLQPTHYMQTMWSHALHTSFN